MVQKRARSKFKGAAKADVEEATIIVNEISVTKRNLSDLGDGSSERCLPHTKPQSRLSNTRTNLGMAAYAHDPNTQGRVLLDNVPVHCKDLSCVLV